MLTELDAVHLRLTHQQAHCALSDPIQLLLKESLMTCPHWELLLLAQQEVTCKRKPVLIPMSTKGTTVCVILQEEPAANKLKLPRSSFQSRQLQQLCCSQLSIWHLPGSRFILHHKPQRGYAGI